MLVMRIQSRTSRLARVTGYSVEKLFVDVVANL